MGETCPSCGAAKADSAPPVLVRYDIPAPRQPIDWNATLNLLLKAFLAAVVAVGGYYGIDFGGNAKVSAERTERIEAAGARRDEKVKALHEDVRACREQQAEHGRQLKVIADKPAPRWGN